MLFHSLKSTEHAAAIDQNGFPAGAYDKQRITLPDIQDRQFEFAFRSLRREWIDGDDRRTS